MKLTWGQLSDGVGELASGDDWTYLITQDDRTVVLTRYGTRYSRPGRHGREADAARVARQAALYAIKIGGAFGAVPETTYLVTAHMRTMAQEYESGLDVTGQPAWRHGYQVPESHPDVTGADPDALYRRQEHRSS